MCCSLWDKKARESSGKIRAHNEFWLKVQHQRSGKKHIGSVGWQERCSGSESVPLPSKALGYSVGSSKEGHRTFWTWTALALFSVGLCGPSYSASGRLAKPKLSTNDDSSFVSTPY